MARKLSPIQVKILDLLRVEAPVAYQPKQIAFFIKEPVATVRVILRRMAQAHVIGQDLRGFYRAIFNLDDLLKTEAPELRIHGLMILGNVTELKQGSHFCYLLETKGKPASGHRTRIILPFQGRDCRIMYSESGTLEIFLSSTKYPLDYSLFEQFVGFLDYVLAGNVRILDLNIVEIGLGRDFKTWRMEGLSSLKIHGFLNAWKQIYKKGEGPRVEVHIHDRITVTDALNILRATAEPLYPSPALQDTKTGYR